MASIPRLLIIVGVSPLLAPSASKPVTRLYGLGGTSFAIMFKTNFYSAKQNLGGAKELGEALPPNAPRGCGPELRPYNSCGL